MNRPCVICDKGILEEITEFDEDYQMEFESSICNHCGAVVLSPEQRKRNKVKLDEYWLRNEIN